MADGFIRIGNMWLPSPDHHGVKQTTSTSVSEAINANNVFVGQRVGNDRRRIDIPWHLMPADQWAELLQMFESADGFVQPVQYYDMVLGRTVERWCYVTDRSATAHTIADDGMTWLMAGDCKLSLVDTGRR